jgi:twitching motility protein PilU
MTREQASQLFADMLALMHTHRASDLFITADFPPALKIDGVITKASPQSLSSEHTAMLARTLMTERQFGEFERTKECNFALAPAGLGRFRVSAFVQLGKIGMVLRSIPTTPPTIDELQLPSALKEVSMNKRGLCIMVGATGSGKSTTLAAMLDWRNSHSFGHIVTIEDPVEFVHPHKNCIVTQREVGLDTESWESGLRNCLRQAPDVIVFGELRDRHTMELVLDFAETGHFCIATLHANSTNQAMDRIINFFPDTRRPKVLHDLSLNLRAMVSQRLLPNANGKGRVAAVEILLASPMIAALIKKGEVEEVKEIMKKSTANGMQTFDQALFQLHQKGLISYEDAMRNADSTNDLRLEIKLRGKDEGATRLDAGTQGLVIV